MAGAHQIGAEVLAATDEVAKALLLQRGNMAEAEFAGGVEAGEANRIAPIGLNAIGRSSAE